jgi:hypothetical protein
MANLCRHNVRVTICLLVAFFTASRFAVAQSPVDMATVLAHPTDYDGKTFWMSAEVFSISTQESSQAPPFSRISLGLTAKLPSGETAYTLAACTCFRGGGPGIFLFPQISDMVALIQAKLLIQPPRRQINVFGTFIRGPNFTKEINLTRGFFDIKCEFTFDGNNFCFVRGADGGCPPWLSPAEAK